MGTVVQQTTRPYSGQWTQLQRSSVPLSPPSWTFSLHNAPVKLPVSWRTPPIPPTWYRSIRARSARLLKSFFPQAVRAFNSNHLTPLWNLIHNPSSWNQDPPPPSHHTTPHHTTCTTWKLLKTSRTLCNSECATHRWVGWTNHLQKHTLFLPICTRHFLINTPCYKDFIR